jgi:hypothetical protein
MTIRLIEKPTVEPALGSDPHFGLVGTAGLSPSGLAVVDASYIFDRAAERVHRTSPALGATVGSLGSVRFFAPTRIARELAWNVDAAARRLHIPANALRYVVSTEFVTRTRFVDLPPTNDLVD